MIDLSSAIASAVNAFAASQPAPVVRVKRDASTGRMVRAEPATSGRVTPVSPVAPVAARSADDARTFLAALRAADAPLTGSDGKRRAPTADEKRAAERAALQAFGVRTLDPHGTAVFQATTTARGLIAAEKRAAEGFKPEPAPVAPTLRGWDAAARDAAADDAAARKRIVIGLVLDLGKVRTASGFHAALVAGGRDDAPIALHLSDAAATAAARALRADLAREHGIDVTA